MRHPDKASLTLKRLKTSRATTLRIHDTCTRPIPTDELMHSSWICESTELTYRTQSFVTPAQFLTLACS